MIPTPPPPPIAVSVEESLRRAPWYLNDGIPAEERPVTDTDPDRIILDIVGSKRFDTPVTGSVLDAVVRETMTGSPTFTLTVHDPDLNLLNSDVLFEEDDDGDREVRAIDVEVDPDRWFRLVKVGFAPASSGRGVDLTLIFEHRVAAWLRQHSKPRKVSRAKMTRAEFIQMLVREIKVDTLIFRCPELHRKQPVERATAADRGIAGDGGAADSSKITVKGKKATKHQRHVIEEVLRAGDRRKAPKKVKIVAIMVITQESLAGVKNVSVSGKHLGPFHQDSSYGPPGNRTDPYKAGLGFFAKALKYHRANTHLSYADLAEKVQRSGDAAPYEQWHKEAAKTVKAFGTGSEAESYTKQFAFTRGVDGKRETTWTTSNRLAGDVNWTFFVVGRKTVVFASEPQLFKARARYRITPDCDALVSLPTGDLDTGKKIKTLSLTVRARLWAIPPGSVIEVDGFGPADGRWLVSDTERSKFKTDMSVNLKKPTKPKREPRSDTANKAKKERAGKDASGSGKAAALYKASKEISDANVPYVYGGGHGGALNAMRLGHIAIVNVGHTRGLDCSSSCSLALFRAGLFGDRMTAITSGEFARSWGKPGKGKTFTVWANGEHVWIEFHGLGNANRFDTSAHGSGGRGPHLRFTERSTSGFSPRHWPGF